MSTLGARRAGLSLVEVLVALLVLSLNVVGWATTLQVILALVRRIVDLATLVDPDDVAAAMCALGCLLPRPTAVPAALDARFRYAGRPASGSRRGLSLVELLVSLTVAVTLLAGMAALAATTGRAARGAHQTIEGAAVRAALPALLREVVETAGRGMGDVCSLDASVGAASVAMSRASSDRSVVTEEVFAASDGGGRPALYLRRVPHARQPWIEDVTAFDVASVRLADDTMDASHRVASVVLRVVHEALDAPLLIDVDLPHRPCLEAPP